MNPQRLVTLARDALLYELALYRSLARWTARRPEVPSGGTAIGYGQLIGPMLWLWIFGSTVEVVAVELVLQNIEAGWAEAVRLPLLVIGVWGVLWMLGMLASHRVRPHVAFEDRLLIRNGALTWVDVPWKDVAAIRLTGHELPGVIRSMHREDALLLVGVGSETNLELVLEGSTELETSQGEMSIERIGLWVDEPRDVAVQIRKLVAGNA